MFRLCLTQHACRARLEASMKHDAQLTRDDTTEQISTPLARVAQWTIDDPWVPVTLQFECCNLTAWGPTVTASVLNWLQMLQWPSDAMVVDDNPGVTWSELVCSWMFCSGVVIPVKRPLADGHEALLCGFSFDHAISDDVQLAELAHAFSTLLAQINVLSNVPRWPATGKGLVRSIYLLGAKRFTNGLLRRLVFPFQS